MIRFEQVSKVYRAADGPVRALSGVSMDVRAGEFVAVRGPSGCGKSTLLMIAGGLAAPTSGDVAVAGRQLPRLSPAARARFRAEQVGFVFQLFHLLPYLTVLENVVAAAAPGREAAARDRAAELLDRFQLAHRLRHRPAELSAGERQRVAVARAMINRPELLLADEPTGNLDSRTGAEILALFEEIHASGHTLLVVTHDDDVAARTRRIVRLLDGRVHSDERKPA